MDKEPEEMQNNYESLPDNLPIPVDDGACDHLVGMQLPNLKLKATSGGRINLSKIAGKVVVYCYPMTGQPGVPLPEGWDSIPGARGCTPQSCAFRDHHTQILQLGARVFGLSTQNSDYQKELALRLQLPFPILSDHAFEFCDALRLPTFTAAGKKLLKRVTIVSNGNSIESVHYPVFPSNTDPQWVIEHLAGSASA